MKGLTNDKNEAYYISVQIPDAMWERKKNARALLKKYKERNNKLPKDRQFKLELKNDKLYVNNVMEKPVVSPPSTEELFPNGDEQKDINRVKIVYGPPKEEKGSSFWAAGVRAKCASDVRKAYKKIRQENPSMDHIMVGFNIVHNGENMYGHADDGEHGGGFKIQDYLRKADMKHVAVFVIRKFGGEHLGQKRFDLINTCTKSVMEGLKLLPEL